MKLNTIIKLPDGRIGTICYNYLDGSGGIWGKHELKMPKGGFGDLPAPEFMLRMPEIKQFIRHSNRSDLEYVGEEFEIVESKS